MEGNLVQHATLFPHCRHEIVFILQMRNDFRLPCGTRVEWLIWLEIWFLPSEPLRHELYPYGPRRSIVFKLNTFKTQNWPYYQLYKILSWFIFLFLQAVYNFLACSSHWIFPLIRIQFFTLLTSNRKFTGGNIKKNFRWELFLHFHLQITPAGSFFSITTRKLLFFLQIFFLQKGKIVLCYKTT